MTRGKHGAAAQTRRKIQGAEASIERYQAKVAELAAEVADLKAHQREREQAHRREVRQLRAERNEGVSPMLGVVQQENARLKEELDRATRDAKETRRRWERTAQGAIEHFKLAHGMTGNESLEALGELFGEDFTIVDAPSLRNMGADAVERIQRARGERR